MFLSAATVWAGGLVAIFVVARVANGTLGPAERVAFFRGLARAYGRAGGIALVAALASGACWLPAIPWDGQLTASDSPGYLHCRRAAQARLMTALRQTRRATPVARLVAKVRRSARAAAVLVAAIAAFSLALALGTVIGT